LPGSPSFTLFPPHLSSWWHLVFVSLFVYTISPLVALVLFSHIDCVHLDFLSSLNHFSLAFCPTPLELFFQALMVIAESKATIFLTPIMVLDPSRESVGILTLSPLLPQFPSLLTVFSPLASSWCKMALRPYFLFPRRFCVLVDHRADLSCVVCSYAVVPTATVHVVS